MIPTILLTLAAVASLLISYTALRSNSRSNQNRFLAYFLFFTIPWSIGDALMLYSSNASLVAVGSLAYLIAPLFVSYFILFFAFNFPKETKIPAIKQVVATSLLFGYALAIAVNPQVFITNIEIAEPINIITPNKAGYMIYSLYFNIFFFWYAGVLINKYRKESGRSRYLVRYFLYAITVTTSFAVISNLLVPNLKGEMRFVWIGPLASFIFSLLISFVIIKHQFLDIRLIVARSLGYALSVITLGLLYGVIAFSLVNLLTFNQTDVSLQQRTFYTITAVCIAFTFQPLKKFFDRITNKLFYRDAYDSSVLLDRLNKILVGNIELDKLLTDSSKLIGDTLKAEFCLFGIKETNDKPRRIIGETKRKFEESDINKIRTLTPKIHMKVIVTDDLTEHDHELRSELRTNGVAVLARLTDNPQITAEGIGYIVFGSKKSGNPYSKDDIKIIEIIADELVIAIQNALRFEEIQNFAETLQEKVDDATRKLRRTNEKLKQLDQTKDDFISMASHQLRTPLTSVKGYVSMVIEGDAGKINAQQRKLLDQAFVSSQRMVYLIADLLNVSRLRTGKFIIEPKPTNLAEVVEGEITQLIETAKGRDLTLTYEKPKNFPTLMLDETKIRQVIMNFADNAIYYTPAGGHIKVALTDKTDSIEFTVVDDGIGVPKTEQHHLFNKFYRAGNAKKARPDGTGLGLFMAKKVVIAQGGAIIFHTEEGKGSTFGFSFAKKPLSPDHFKKLPDTTQIPSTTLK